MSADSYIKPLLILATTELRIMGIGAIYMDSNAKDQQMDDGQERMKSNYKVFAGIDLISFYAKECMKDNLPQDIIRLIHLFWFMDYKFDTRLEHKSDRLLTISSQSMMSRSITSVDPIRDGTHILKFRIIKKAFEMIIGLCSNGNNYSYSTYDSLYHSGTDGRFTTGGDGYGYMITSGLKSGPGGSYMEKYGVIIDEGDVVVMIVDFINKSLSFRVNDEYLGISHYIDKDEYKAAVYMRTGLLCENFEIEGGTIEIVES